MYVCDVFCCVVRLRCVSVVSRCPSPPRPSSSSVRLLVVVGHWSLVVGRWSLLATRYSLLAGRSRFCCCFRRLVDCCVASLDRSWGAVRLGKRSKSGLPRRRRQPTTNTRKRADQQTSRPGNRGHGEQKQRERRRQNNHDISYTIYHTHQYTITHHTEHVSIRHVFRSYCYTPSASWPIR